MRFVSHQSGKARKLRVPETRIAVYILKIKSLSRLLVMMLLGN
jgi:hypothetical protein